MGKRQKSQQRIIEQLERQKRSLMESLYDNLVDPREQYFDDDGTTWSPLGFGSGDKDPPEFKPAFKNEQELHDLRNRGRLLAQCSGYAINGHENRISYIVGEGHVYRAVVEKNAGEEAQAAADAVQEVIEEFCEENCWGERQQESVLRVDRDGECFLRMFENANGLLVVRFVEPGDVKCPVSHSGDPAWSYGIHTEPDDVETVIEYAVRDEIVPAAEMQHRRGNADFNVKRGTPLFYPVEKQLKRSERINRNLAALIDVQTKIAMIRKHSAGTNATGVNALIDANSTSRVNPATGQTQRIMNYGPATILDAYNGLEYDFPANQIQSSGAIEADKHILRSIATRLVMPEFMFTSDASNANYASTMVAEGPAVKLFRRWQERQKRWDLAILYAQVELAVRIGRLPANVWDLVEIQVEAPSVAVRDTLKEAQSNQILFAAGVLSPQTWSLQNGLDYGQEQRNIDESEASYPGRHQRQRSAPSPFGQDGMGNLDPAMAGALQGAREAISGWRGYPYA